MTAERRARCGARIRRLVVAGRYRCGWTQEDAAARAEISVRTLQNIEAGNGASTYTLLKLLDVYGIALEKLEKENQT